MSVESNKAAVRRYFDEVINAGRLEVVRELFRQDPAADQALAAAAALRASFPDLHMAVDDLVGVDDLVVVKVTCSGTPRGGFMDIPPTDVRVTFDGVELARFDADGRIVGEVWHVMDTGAIYRQLARAGAHH